MFYGTQNVQLIVLWLVSGRRRPAVLCCMYVRSLLLLVPVSPGIIPSLVLAVAEIGNEALTLPSSCRCMCLELSNLLCRP